MLCFHTRFEIFPFALLPTLYGFGSYSLKTYPKNVSQHEYRRQIRNKRLICEVHYTRTLKQSCMQQVKTPATAKMKLFLAVLNNFQLWTVVSKRSSISALWYQMLQKQLLWRRLFLMRVKETVHYLFILAFYIIYVFVDFRVNSWWFLTSAGL